jgi:hypothetical protein
MVRIRASGGSVCTALKSPVVSDEDSAGLTLRYASRFGIAVSFA